MVPATIHNASSITSCHCMEMYPWLWHFACRIIASTDWRLQELSLLSVCPSGNCLLSSTATVCICWQRCRHHPDSSLALEVHQATGRPGSSSAIYPPPLPKKSNINRAELIKLRSFGKSCRFSGF